MMPDQTNLFQIETDASKYATGAVLTQLDSNGTDIPFCLSQRLSHRQNKIMKFMTGNYQQSFEHWKNGDTTSKDHHTQQQFYQITRTSLITEKRRN